MLPFCESPLGWIPYYQDLDWRGLPGFSRENFEETQEELFVNLYDRLPAELESVRNLILSGLWRMGERWDVAHPSIGS
jgi:phosphoenolpyruvate carboxykinase (GTP)